jgi:hypothetical protein
MRSRHSLERYLRSTILASWKARLKIESKNKSYFSTARLRRISERSCAQINFEVGIPEAALSKPQNWNPIGRIYRVAGPALRHGRLIRGDRQALQSRGLS